MLTTALLIVTKVEAIQMSIDRWMKKMQYIKKKKENAVYISYDRILFSLKKEENSDPCYICQNMMNHKNIMLSEIRIQNSIISPL